MIPDANTMHNIKYDTIVEFPGVFSYWIKKIEAQTCLLTP